MPWQEEREVSQAPARARAAVNKGSGAAALEKRTRFSTFSINIPLEQPWLLVVPSSRQQVTVKALCSEVDVFFGVFLAFGVFLLSSQDLSS